MFQALIESPYFGVGCCIAAFFLYLTSINDRKPVLIILTLEFILCNAASILGLRLTSALDGWQMYLVYSVIQICAICAILVVTSHGFKGSLVVAILIAFAAIYNIVMIAPYFGYDVLGYSGAIMYEIYSYLLAFIMILQLIYMTLYNKAVYRGLGKYAGTYTLFIDRANFNSALAFVANILVPKRAQR